MATGLAWEKEVERPCRAVGYERSIRALPGVQGRQVTLGGLRRRTPSLGIAQPQACRPRESTHSWGETRIGQSMAPGPVAFRVGKLRLS